MSPKRYIVFGPPPTVAQLRTRSVSSDTAAAAWTTHTIHTTSAVPPARERPAQLAKPPPEQPIGPTILACPAGPSGQQSRPLADSSESKGQHAGSAKRPRLRTEEPDGANAGVASKSVRVDGYRVATAASESIDYYQSQLEYRDSFGEWSGDISLTPTPGNRTSCLLSRPTQRNPHDPSPPMTTNRQASQSQTTYSESMVVNPPQWHFDVRSCTPLDHLAASPGSLYNILFHLCEKKPLATIGLQKPRKNGASTVDIAHFECMDDSGSVLKLVLWDDIAESLDSACLVGDLIYLSGIAISTYHGEPQASSTAGTRAQICYRLRPTHSSHLEKYCPDMRLAYDPTTRRVSQLVDWAKTVFL